MSEHQELMAELRAIRTALERAGGTGLAVADSATYSPARKVVDEWISKHLVADAPMANRTFVGSVGELIAGMYDDFEVGPRAMWGSMRTSHLDPWSKPHIVTAMLQMGTDGRCLVNVWHGPRKDCTIVSRNQHDLVRKDLRLVLREARAFLKLREADPLAELQPSSVSR
jgi:hypothetical protein